MNKQASLCNLVPKFSDLAMRGLYKCLIALLADSEQELSGFDTVGLSLR